MRFPRPPDDNETQHCPRCQLHFPVAGEAPERELARLRDHDQRLRPGYAVAWNFQSQYHDRMKSALHSRDNWKAALAEVLLAHEEAADGNCKVCHEKEFPCSTWRKLERVNRGIHREVETLAALDDDELSRELYGDGGDYRSA